MSDLEERVRRLAAEFDRAFAEPLREREARGQRALAIRVGGEPYVLRIEGLAAVATSARIVALPGGPPIQLGIAGIRGVLVTVFSLPALLGYAVMPEAIGWLAVAAGPRPVALGFEELEGQITLEPTALAPVASARRHVEAILASGSDPKGLARIGDKPPAGVLDLASILRALETG